MKGILPPNVILKKNNYGYYQIDPIPNEKNLEAFYEKKYYQNASPDNNAYAKNYTRMEKEYIGIKLKQKEILIKKFIKKTAKNFLDVGCGEGFALDYFSKKNMEVLGIDFSSFGIKSQNPQMLCKLIQGNINKTCDDLIKQNYKFDVINMDNVLEHVCVPEITLRKCYNLLSFGGVLIIKVPNDFNPLQKYMIDKKRFLVKNGLQYQSIYHILIKMD